MTTELAVQTKPIAATGVCTARSRPGDPQCSHQATHAYLWDWGETGTCCPEHITVLKQISETLGRGVTFTPLDPHAPRVMQRDERVQLNARILAAESELADAKTRGLEMHQQLAQIAQQAQAATLRLSATQSELSDARTRIDQLETELLKTAGRAAELQDERNRLSHIVDAKPSQRAQDLQAELDDLRGEIARVKQTRDELHRVRDEQSKEIDHLRAELAKLPAAES